MITGLEESFWAYQYLTRVSGNQGLTWWPVDGVRAADTKEQAEGVALRAKEHGRYERVRLVHITRSMRFVDLEPATEGSDGETT